MPDTEPGARNLVQWLEYQQQLHPEHIELGLERVSVVADRLQLLPVAGICVVVAGTNGKGSSIAMLEAIYRAAGYRVGCYTSPHIHDYRERVRIDGVAVTEQAFCTAFEAIEHARGSTELTFFEFGTLAALQILRRQELDLLLLEVGLGGRLDAVNIVDSDLALITQIDIDHSDWLGDTREKIGTEKAGVMRSGRPVVCADPNPPTTVAKYAQHVGAELFTAGPQFTFSVRSDKSDWFVSLNGRELQLPRPVLQGRNQLVNAAAVVQVVELLQLRLPVKAEELASGLLNVELPGRFEVRKGPPVMIFDVAHNPQACRALAENLDELARKGKRIAVLGMLADKNVEASLSPLLDGIDAWYLATLDEPRGSTAYDLQAALINLGCAVPITLCKSVREAVQLAHGQAKQSDQLVVFGSFHTVAAAR